MLRRGYISSAAQRVKWRLKFIRLIEYLKRKERNEGVVALALGTESAEFKRN
ncbi:MAG TPA: hypothetical protein VGD40_09910 [Chryseosolibacter sp.]